MVLLEKLIQKPFDVDAHVKKEGLEVVNDSGAIKKVVQEIIDTNPTVVEQYKGGKEQALNFLVGQVMRQTSGAASPDTVIKIIKKLI